MPSDEITSIVKGTVVSSTFPKEKGGEKAYSARRGFRNVDWYVFLETDFFKCLGDVYVGGIYVSCEVAQISDAFVAHVCT